MMRWNTDEMMREGELIAYGTLTKADPRSEMREQNADRNARATLLARPLLAPLPAWV